MKFYNREKELDELEKVRQLAFSEHSKLTVLTGRRRIGKTSLIFRSCENTPTLYWFVKRSNEADLCSMFSETASQVLNISIPGKIYNFTKLFEFVMEQGIRNKFNLVIDEFQEFGKKYGNYFSIIGAIAEGRNTINEMEEKLGISLGGYLKRLEEDYNIVSKKRPILSKEGTQTVRYEISDPFLRFWFSYFEKYQSLLEIRNFSGLSSIIKRDYPTYSGIMLEEYFRQKMIESGEFLNIGSWWEAKGNANEKDIVGIYLFEKKALLAEVKRQRKNFKPELFQSKVEAIHKKVLFKYEIEGKCLTLEDM